MRFIVNTMSYPIESIISAVDQSVRRVIEVLREQGQDGGREGGYFSLAVAPGFHLFSYLVGEVVDIEKAERYARLSREKADRLIRNFHRGHISSWQSRDLEHESYGGAVKVEIPLRLVGPDTRLPENISGVFSFSGLPESGDEAAMLLAAHRMKFNIETVEVIAVSANEVARQIFVTGV